MLLHSTIISVYLKRRSRLFQVYSTQPKQTSFSSQQSQQNSNSEFSTAEGIKKWLINFGQLLEASPIQIRQLRRLIESIPQTYISLSKQQLINLLALSISFQPASKISNIMYYLSRKSKAFRKQLQTYLKQQAQQLCKKTNLLTSFKEKIMIILTDMFIFGIYLTQTQFINNVFNSLFQQPQLQILDQQRIQKTIFQMYYIKHYVQILTYPSVMLQRNRIKFINTILQYFYQKCFKILSHMLDLTNVSLKKLQLLYSQPPNTRARQTGQTQQLKKQQLEYLNYVHKYQNFKKLIVITVHTIINSLRESYQSYQQFEAIIAKIQKEYEPIFCEAQGDNKIIQKHQQYNKEQKDQTTQKESNSEDLFPESENSYFQKKDKKLLDSIYNKCKNYHKHIYLQPNPIYHNTSSRLQINTNLSQPFTYLQLLPESYLSNLCNIADEQSAKRMSRLFLESYNKHCNRANLVKTIFKDLHDRNNIVYIVKVLYDISLVEKYQIDELIKEELQIIKQKSKGRINKGIYGKYASIFVQLIKFKFIDPELYLKGLLELIKKSNVFNLQQKQVSETQSPTAQALNRNQSQIPLTQLINLLQKCGLQIYYFSLNCHILFNEIISHIYRHIRKKIISYDIEIINRFNGLVLYLQNIKKLQNIQIKKLSIDQIINQRNFENHVKIFQKQLKNSSGYQNVCQILVNSIQSQNYIQSYLYAELIYEINSIQLDNIIKYTTFNKIKLGLDLGNYQKATIWARFLGQLHRSKIIAQNQFLDFLRQTILRDYFQRQQCASTKIICSALEACTSYMKKTKKISQFNETLRFLLCFKKELLRVRGLQNTILQHQIQQIMQNFHTAFKWIRSVQDCNFLQSKILQKRNIDVEKLLQNFQQDCKLRQENLRVDKQLKMEESEAKTNQFMEKQAKFIQKKLNFDKTIPYSEYKQIQLMEQLIQKIQISELETNSSRIQKQINSNDSTSQMLQEKVQDKPKKIKVVGRSRNSKRLQKIQVTI